MIGRISRFMTHFIGRWLLDPPIFAMLSALLASVITFWLTPQTPINMVKMWGDGFQNLLAFGMQVVLIIVAGHALASSAPIKSLLRTVASAVKTPVQGVMLVTFFGSVAHIVNQRFGLAVGAIFTREVTRQVPDSDYPLLVVHAYIGFLTWGGDFSGSVPLLATTPGNPIKYITRLIPVGDTPLSDFNIFITAASVAMMPFIARMVMSRPPGVVSINPKLFVRETDFQKQLPKGAPPPERLEENRILALIIGVLGIAYLAMYFDEHDLNITTNTVNPISMIAGLLLHKAPVTYTRAIGAAVRSTAGILVQFPFYAGVQLMTEHSGLGGLIIEFFINVTNKGTSLVMTFSSSALINFAIPSSGEHWIIRGPFVMPATQTLGAGLGKSIIVIAYGEQWMNVAQPFQALPTLATAELGIRDIMGYCIIALLFSNVIFVIGLTLF